MGAGGRQGGRGGAGVEAGEARREGGLWGCWGREECEPGRWRRGLTRIPDFPHGWERQQGGCTEAVQGERGLAGRRQAAGKMLPPRLTLVHTLPFPLPRSGKNVLESSLQRSISWRMPHHEELHGEVVHALRVGLAVPLVGVVPALDEAIPHSVGRRLESTQEGV